MRPRIAASTKLTALIALVVGCSGEPSTTSKAPATRAPAAPAPALAPSCERARRGEAPLPVDGSTGASVALARLGDRTIAYVADDDAAALRTIDVGSRAELASTPLGGAPAAVLVLADGRVVVSLHGDASAVVLEPGLDLASPLVRRCVIAVPAEPTGLAATPDGATVLVVSRWGHALSAFDAATFAPRFTVDLPRDPRAVVTSSDGRKAYVAHVAGARLSVIDLDVEHAVRSIRLAAIEDFDVAYMPASQYEKNPSGIERRRRLGGQGYAIVRGPGDRILAPQVFTDPGNGIVSGWGGYGDEITVLGDVASLDERDERRTGVFHTARLGARDCLLPRSAAVDVRSGRLLVACLGLDRIVFYDAKAVSPHDHELGRVEVGAGPTGVAVDADGRRAVVWSQFDQSLAIVPLDQPLSGKSAVKADRLELERRSSLEPEVARGRVLFHAAGDRRISFDGRACASCHPDGRDDAITWTTPGGQRQTPMLLERLAGTAPYGWDGERETAPSHMLRTLERLSGTGLPADDRSALLAYVGSLRAPVLGGPATELVARGAELFHAEETQCATCHVGDDVFTDRTAHDVKSHIASDLSHLAFDTPSLRFVGRSAPYFHDGRYAALEALLVGVDGTMGHTAQLSADDRAALVAYLETL